MRGRRDASSGAEEGKRARNPQRGDTGRENLRRDGSRGRSGDEEALGDLRAARATSRRRSQEKIRTGACAIAECDLNAWEWIPWKEWQTAHRGDEVEPLLQNVHRNGPRTSANAKSRVTGPIGDGLGV
eukprot:scaffold644_cov357-Pavlova_lutheri.AAC.7